MTVAVWEAMRRRPVRFLFGAWPLRSWAFLLSGLVVGPVVLFVCAALAALIAGFAPAHVQRQQLRRAALPAPPLEIRKQAHTSPDGSIAYRDREQSP